MSPKAYMYVREKFGRNIPHPDTIKQWYRCSDLDVKPGIGKKSLEALEKLAKEMNEKHNTPLIISLLFDEMAIMRNLSWCRSKQKFTGLVDCGTVNEVDFTLANNVIVFMACGINSHFQQPIAFNFIQTLNATDRVDLVKKVVSAISESGVKIASITFDGYAANSSMCELLGANFSFDDDTCKTYFLNPYDDSKIFIVFDPSHMEKLIRNTLGMHVDFVR